MNAPLITIAAFFALGMLCVLLPAASRVRERLSRIVVKVSR